MILKLITYTFRLILFSILLAPIFTNAQNLNRNWCGTDEEVNKSLSNNHDLIKKRKELEYFTQNYITTNKKNTGYTLYVIPIVFHIIHNYGSANISTEQIEDAVRIINEDFKKLNPDIVDVIPQFDSIAADCGIEFRLAKKDPFGNCTQGITRTLSDLTYNAGENVKDLISWNTQNYFNVWVVANIASGAGAYAYYPCSAPSLSHEGVVNRYTQLGSGRTLTHEIGHYFNLAHTWGSSNEAGLSTNCSIDDGVNDTPNTIGTFGCNLSHISCTSLDNVQNYMDYASCTKMFTEGQKARMIAAIEGSSCRDNLWINSNLIATGTNDGYTAPPCVPIADFINNFDEGCEGIPVLFNDKSYGADVDSTWTWSWSFPGGDPSVSNLQNPFVTYNNFGVYGATLIVSNISGSDTITKTDLVKVKSVTGETASFTEGIENSTFPIHPTDARKNWDIINPNGDPDSWQRTTTAYFSGSASVVIKNQYIAENSLHSLITPAIDMSNIVSPVNLTFKLAYSQRTSATNDNLKVYVSKNCGLSWALKYTKSGSLLSSTDTIISSPFIPDTSQWKEVSINLNMYAGQSNIRIKFQMTSDLGNYLYLDNISIDGTIAPLSVTISSSTDATCKNACDGMAVVKAVGGIYTYPYTYQWSGGQTNDSATALCAGTYTVFVTDSIGDSTTATVVISEPANVSVSIATTGATCSGCNDGAATATVSGGSGSYSYLWINDSGDSVSTSAVASGLAPGTYVVLVTDLICNETINESAVIIVTSILEQFENNNFKIYPNPFDNNAILSFKLVSRNNISIKVFDILGKKVGSLGKNNLKAGEYQLNFNDIVKEPVQGLYFLHITIGDERITRKIICIKP